MEFLNIGHFGSRSTVPLRRLSLFQRLIYTVEPMNKGHIGIKSTVPCKEAVFISEIKINHIEEVILGTEVDLILESPLSEILV